MLFVQLLYSTPGLTQIDLAGAAGDLLVRISVQVINPHLIGPEAV